IAVLDICHRVILSDSAHNEWKTHASKFARSWWVSMLARRKVERVEDSVDDEVRRPLERSNLTDKQRAASEKDLHLIEDALRTHRIVVGIDLRLTEYVERAGERTRKLRTIHFVDPREVTADKL